ncbi:MAG: hypothetical protein KY460_09450 [Actinobacteria bacterium]|nr:hypothetical protein [Actinomycetota bacterium]
MPGTVRDTTVVSYRGALHSNVIPHSGHIRLSKLTPQHVRAMLTAIQDKGAGEDNPAVDDDRVLRDALTDLLPDRSGRHAALLRVMPDRRDEPDHVARIHDGDLDVVSQPIGPDGTVHRAHALHVGPDMAYVCSSPSWLSTPPRHRNSPSLTSVRPIRGQGEFGASSETGPPLSVVSGLAWWDAVHRPRDRLGQTDGATTPTVRRSRSGTRLP